MLTDSLQVIGCIFGLAGSWFVGTKSNKKRTIGFYFYLISNGMWLLYGIWFSIWGLVIMYICYTALSIRGIYNNVS